MKMLKKNENGGKRGHEKRFLTVLVLCSEYLVPSIPHSILLETIGLHLNSSEVDRPLLVYLT